jgi:hypothetical protein
MSDKQAQSETFEFDKFMDEIVVKEAKKEENKDEKLTPQREYIRRYRERPQNRIRFGK